MAARHHGATSALVDCHRRYYSVLHGICGPKRTAPPPPCAAALVGAACIPHGGREAMAHSDMHGYGAAEKPRATPSPSRQAANCVPCAPAFELLRHTVQEKCGACACVHVSRFMCMCVRARGRACVRASTRHLQIALARYFGYSCGTGRLGIRPVLGTTDGTEE